MDPVGGTTGAGFLVGSAAVPTSWFVQAIHLCCCCGGCGHVGNAPALSKRSVMSTAVSPSAPVTPSSADIWPGASARFAAPAAAVAMLQSTPEISAAPRGDTPLETVIERWFQAKPDMSVKTAHECRMIFRRLGEVVGGMSIMNPWLSESSCHVVRFGGKRSRDRRIVDRPKPPDHVGN